MSFLSGVRNLSTTVKNILIIGVVVLLVVVAVVGYRSCRTPPKPPTITKISDTNTTITTEGTKLDPKQVIEQIGDADQVTALMAENKKLKIQVQQLTLTLAKNTSSGHGTITLTPAQPPVQTTPAPGNTVTLLTNPSSPVSPAVAQNIDFKDWRLHFWSLGNEGQYTLTQQYEILNSSGRLKDGTIANVVKLFEIGPKGERIPVETVKTTSVVAVDTSKHWYLSPTLQAGYGLVVQDSVRSQGAIVGLQLFKRGYSKAAEDSSFSLLTPAMFLTDTIRQPGLLPFSANLGRVKYQPLKDLWVSPFIGYDVNKKTLGKVGLSLTASF